jgi:uncharacterized protein with von Willebrand factor type A (vWA) domain
MGGERLIYAKAAMGALALRALEEEKRFTCLIFSDTSSIERIPITNKESFVRACEFAYMGGTDFQAPIRAATEEIIKTHGQITGGTDLIMITDGEAHLDASFIQWFLAAKAEHDIELSGFFIGGDGKVLNQVLDKSQEFTPGTGSIVDVMNAMRK